MSDEPKVKKYDDCHFREELVRPDVEPRPPGHLIQRRTREKLGREGVANLVAVIGLRSFTLMCFLRLFFDSIKKKIGGEHRNDRCTPINVA